MDIKGLEGLTVADVRQEVSRGAKFVVFTYAMSFLIITLKRSSAVHFIRAGQGTFGASLPYTLLSFFIGWWGFPWGLVYTPMAIIQNLAGGTDVTAAVMESLGAGGPPQQQGLPPVQVQ
jgi:hypothetical protein